jgi:hypothetical protein
LPVLKEKKLKIKALRYLISNDKKLFFKFFLKNPFIYSYRYLLSFLFSKRKKERGAILFGINNLSEFKNLLKNRKNPLILGFSYCQKPLDCPSLRFSERCIGNTCGKCLISKYIDRENIHVLSITTVNYLGEKIYEIIKQSPGKIIFIISACDIAISMFEDLSKALNLKGIALPLEEKVCNSFSAFLLAEKGKKPIQTKFPLKNTILLDELLENRNK